MAPRLVIALAATALCACGSTAAQSTAAGSRSIGSTASASTSGSSSDSTSTAGSGPVGSGHPAAAAPCGPTAARTLAQSRRARVYATGGKVFACAAGSQKRYVLGVSRSCLGADLVGLAAVNGVLAAYASERCGIDTGVTQVVIRRLTDGKVLHQTPATATALGVESHLTVTALVLAADGAAAWVSAGGSIMRNSPIVEVHAFERGRLHRLDQGRAIDRTTLRLSGRRLRWKHGAGWRSATLS